MAIGKVISLFDNSPYAVVRDEYGVDHTVDKRDLPSGATEDQDVAYQVRFMSTQSSAQTLDFDE